MSSRSYQVCVAADVTVSQIIEVFAETQAMAETIAKDSCMDADFDLDEGVIREPYVSWTEPEDGP